MTAPVQLACPVCSELVPAGVFCGSCGAHLNPQPGDGPRWLRPRAFCAAPEENVLRPALTSALFPHLSQLSRKPFRLGLVLMLAIMALAVETRLQVVLVVTAVMGLPLLFLIYRHQSGVYRDLRRWALVSTVVLGLTLGVGWVLLTGDLVVRETGAPFDAGAAGRRVLRDGLGVAQGGAILMMLPAVVVRLLKGPKTRRSLDGFVFGVLGVLSFTAAATLTRLAPQFAAGPVAQAQPVEWLLVEAAIRGVTVPITAACAGGLFGAALWFTRPSGAQQIRRSTLVATIGLFGAGALALYATLGVVDAAGLPQFQMLAWHVALMFVAVVALRIGLQLALLHEDHGPDSGVPMLCLHCRNVVPDMAFCPSCGAAECASSEQSRAQRRRVSPLARPPADGPDEPIWPGYAVPAQTYTCPQLSRVSASRVLGIWGATVAVIGASAVAVSALIAQPSVTYNCPPDCGSPPTGTPVAGNPRYSAPDGAWSVAYPAVGSSYEIAFEPDSVAGSFGVTARHTAGDRGVMRLAGLPAGGRSAQEVATDLLRRSYPNARTSYEIPNPMVGYQPGYGVVADIWPQDEDARYRHLRVLLLVAVRNDLALVAGAVGPFREFGPTVGPGRPSGANLEIAQDLGRYVNSFMWRGDPPR